ncbi:MAG: restriction endonuclease subunit S, partial [Cyclonatronaceae bacterium]
MREGWELFKLKEVCEIRPAKRETKEFLNEDDLVSFVPMSHLNEERKDFHEEEAKPLKSVYKGYTYFKDDDVLLAKITPCFENGKMGIAKGLTNGVGFGSSEFIVYRPDSRLIPEYLFYFLLLPKFRVQGEKMMGGAVGHQRIPKEFYEDYEIPIPPLPEQKRIVAILDEAFEAIDKAKANIERNIQNAEELFQSKLNEVFSQRGDGWEEKPLGELTHVKSGGTPRRSTNDYWDNGTIPWYSSGELNDLFTTGSERLITEKGLLESNAKLFPKGSLLIGMYDTAALKMSILDRDATFNQAISGAKPNEGLNLQFVMHAINANKTELMEQ